MQSILSDRNARLLSPDDVKAIFRMAMTTNKPEPVTKAAILMQNTIIINALLKGKESFFIAHTLKDKEKAYLKTTLLLQGYKQIGTNEFSLYL